MPKWDFGHIHCFTTTTNRKLNCSLLFSELRLGLTGKACTGILSILELKLLNFLIFRSKSPDCMSITIIPLPDHVSYLIFLFRSKNGCLHHCFTMLSSMTISRFSLRPVIICKTILLPNLTIFFFFFTFDSYFQSHTFQHVLPGDKCLVSILVLHIIVNCVDAFVKFEQWKCRKPKWYIWYTCVNKNDW